MRRTEPRQREPLRFAFTRRGDAAWGRLWSATADGPTPLVLVVPRVGASMHAPAVVALCTALAEGGLAAAAVDLPLQGERASRKLSARLAACAARPERAGTDRLLWQEFLRQAELDLAAAVDALVTRRELDLTRVACLAFEPGAEAAAALAARDTRVRAFRRVEAGEAPAPTLRFLRERLGGAG